MLLILLLLLIPAAIHRQPLVHVIRLWAVVVGGYAATGQVIVVSRG